MKESGVGFELHFEHLPWNVVAGIMKTVNIIALHTKFVFRSVPTTSQTILKNLGTQDTTQSTQSIYMIFFFNLQFIQTINI